MTWKQIEDRPYLISDTGQVCHAGKKASAKYRRLGLIGGTPVVSFGRDKNTKAPPTSASVRALLVKAFGEKVANDVVPKLVRSLQLAKAHKKGANALKELLHGKTAAKPKKPKPYKKAGRSAKQS